MRVLKTGPLFFPPFAVLFGLGDVIAQVFIGEKDATYDYKRTGRAWIFGTFLLGPLAHWHFNFLEWLVVRKVQYISGDGCGFLFRPYNDA